MSQPQEAQKTQKSARLPSRRRMRAAERLWTYGLMVALSIVFLAPFAWMVSTSLKPSDQVVAGSPFKPPETLEWRNYADVMRQAPFHVYFKNTAVVVALSILGAVLSSSLCGYGFARLRFPGRDKLFLLVLATMMLPPAVTLIPAFVIFRYLGWINTFKPLVLPFFFGVPFYIFLFRQFFRTIPRDLEDAAKIDGATSFETFWRIMVPLSKPAVITVTIFTFVMVYNDFMGPLVYLNSESKWTVALGLASLQGALMYKTPWNFIMAASVITLIPALLVFFASQRYLVEGIVTSGMKV